jgi:uncharacterized DUF497 family protein
VIELDPAKEVINQAKHRISLARAVGLEVLAVIEDDRFTQEIRFRAYGLIDGMARCLAYTLRDGNIRPISLRRAHAKEMKRYAPQR